MCTKTCSKCGETKEVSEFGERRNVCKKCVSIQRKDYKKKYYQENKEFVLHQCKTYRESNRDKKRESDKKYREKNRDKMVEYLRNYYQINKQTHCVRSKAYYNENKEWLKTKMKEYSELNKEAIAINTKERLMVDPIFKAAKLMRRHVYRALKIHDIPKNSPTEQILGCTYDELVNHLEDNNYGFTITEKGVDVDHIIPMSVATTEEEVLKLCHYTNLQLLPSHYNRYVKKDKVWSPEHFHRYYFNSI